MADPQSSIVKAPDYAFYRSVASADPTDETDVNHGMNCANYEHANVQVIPNAGVTPTVEIRWWSAEAGKFVSESTAITKAGPGAGVPYEFSVACYGRIMFVKVTVATGPVKIYVSGFNPIHPT